MNLARPFKAGSKFFKHFVALATIEWSVQSSLTRRIICQHASPALKDRAKFMPPLRGEDMPPLRGEDMPPLRGEDMPALRVEDMPPLRGEEWSRSNSLK
jgi:hypothetical protein